MYQNMRAHRASPQSPESLTLTCVSIHPHPSIPVDTCLHQWNMDVGRAELLGGGGPSSLKFLPGVGLGGSVKFLIYIFFLGGGAGNLETPLATPLVECMVFTLSHFS